MDIRKVKKLIELLEESNIDEIEIKEGEESVRISRNTHPVMAPYAHAPMAPPPAFCRVVRRQFQRRDLSSRLDEEPRLP